ncbi:hypothetical protein DFH06DRAFT_1315450 [Mycena polygramma]|nr:hypothetical protein DFH06DRAFT_1315450 [Mycena polygramma]
MTTSLASDSTDSMLSEGNSVMYYTFGLVAQTLVFGKDLYYSDFHVDSDAATRINTIMFSITSFMYLLAAAYWGYSLFYVGDRIQVYIKLSTNERDFSSGTDAIRRLSPLFNALITMNYALSDGIVVWRAWVICLRGHRKYMCIPFFFLFLTSVAVLSTIMIRIANFNSSWMPHLAAIINISQMTAVGASVISNLSSMGVVGATLWRHWRTIRVAFPDRKQGTNMNHTLALVVESGVLYSISAISLLLFSVIPGKLPTGNTLGDLYTPINVQLAGAYPAVVLLLVSSHGSLTSNIPFS